MAFWSGVLVSSSSERLYRRPASVWRESAVNAREGIPRFDQATDVRAIPHAYFTYEQSGQRSQKSFEKLQKFRKLRPFSVLWERPLWWASLYSRALTTICVDEVPTPRSRPTTVRQGNGGLQTRHGVGEAGAKGAPSEDHTTPPSSRIASGGRLVSRGGARRRPPVSGWLFCTRFKKRLST